MRWLALFLLLSLEAGASDSTWIRINWLGYQPARTKVAVWCSKEATSITRFEVVDARTGKTVYTHRAGKAFGAYGPFTQTYRLAFTAFRRPGTYYLRAGNTRSPQFRIAENVYEGTADFCLRYLRQQRCGFNPFLKDSCHTRDGYTMYGPMPDSTYINAIGGWHDASDYLQYVTTSANAAYHLLMAYRDFPGVFTDEKTANGLSGRNGRADVLDEAVWGLDWLLRMHPRQDWLFNQIADDRDHISMRIPKLDSQYGKGYERPVYFVNGQPQGLFQYRNRTTGKASTAGKFASAFALGSRVLRQFAASRPGDSALGRYARLLEERAHSSFRIGYGSPGVAQTAPGRAPYFYEEDNWADDMELAAAALGKTTAERVRNRYLQLADSFSRLEPVTPWLGSDTARHYQWYPFINLGHYELALQTEGPSRQRLAGLYREGIARVWLKARTNAFYRGVPFIWCSNNLTTSFAIQCLWYRKLTGDQSFRELEQASIDWLFGCNPWGTSMVYGLPSWGDTPVDPHSAFTHLKNYPIDGGLVDGPVYGSIFGNLKGIRLYQQDAYAPFQSRLAVYHDDYGDYSTNEPTMDGTASLVYLLAAQEAAAPRTSKLLRYGGAVIRGDTSQKKIALVFTGDEWADGAESIRRTLNKAGVKASFFLTGRFLRNPAFAEAIQKLRQDGHYIGAHSDHHLLYCSWENRDSLLVTRDSFLTDLDRNYKELERVGVPRSKAPWFLPPFEWYNDSIATWTRQAGLQLINYTPGTLSHADYTRPSERSYRSSAAIVRSIREYERRAGLNGFMLLMHAGTHPERTDKLYRQLPALIDEWKRKGYKLVPVNQLIAN